MFNSLKKQNCLPKREISDLYVYQTGTDNKVFSSHYISLKKKKKKRLWKFKIDWKCNWQLLQVLSLKTKIKGT